jgi:rubrerythrin
LELMKLGIVVRPTGQKVDGEQEDDEPAEPDLGMDYKEAIVFAIEKERKALRLYVDLAAMARDRVSREMLITLAEEEAMHGARFEAEYNMLMRKQS